jgi:iron(III) transport system ATP-binding protein
MTTLEVSHLDVQFGARKVISDLSFSLNTGEIASLLGPSGCGKTTLLRAIAGLLTPSGGTIRLGSQLIGLSSLSLAPHKRSTGYVPQQGALFPHLNVARNIAFGIDRKKKSASEIKSLTFEMLELIGMPGYEEAMPSELSGGQQTRVALARALVIKPKMVLLDEPFSALDAHLRNELRADVIALLRSQSATAILVTHDREEALVASDKVILMRDGAIAQFGTPEDVYENPTSPEIAVSTGDAMILPAQQNTQGVISYPLKNRETDFKVAHSGFVVIRPEEVVVGSDLAGGMSAQLLSVDYYGHDAMLTFALAHSTDLIKVRVVGHSGYSVGDTLSIKHEGPVRFFKE